MYNFTDASPCCSTLHQTLASLRVSAYHVARFDHSTPPDGGAKTGLTDTFNRSAPPGKHSDHALEGFGLRVGKNRKTFIVLVTSGRRKSIGVWPHQSFAEARRDGAHHTHTAFDDALKAYLAEAERTVKPLTY